MLRRALMSAAAGLVLAVAPATAALAHGSDSPTPYQVTSTAIVLPAGHLLGDNAHVNVHFVLHGVDVSVNLSTEIAGKPGHDLASVGRLEWSRLGVPEGAYVTWVQVSGFDEHFGEGGQKPVCVTRQPIPASTPTPSLPSTRPTWTPKPCPTRTVHPAPTPTPSATRKPCPTKSPATTKSPAATPTPTPSATAPAPTHSPRPTATPTPTAVVAAAPTSSPSHAGPAPSPSVTAFVLADDSATAPGGAVLASTGVDSLVAAAIAAALVVLGAAVTLVARSRQRATDAV